AKNNINEQISILNLLFQQLSFETDTISEIIIASRTRGYNTFNANQISLYELSKMSKLNIIYINETLIFEIIIPLINSVELTLYRVIPLPVVKNDHFNMRIIPEYSYIAISNTHKYYLTLSLNHLMMCRQIAAGTLYPETQSLRLGASELPCEVELFIKPSGTPSTCPIHYLDITRSIYHKLKYQNAWIYIVKTTDNVDVSCENRDQAINLQLTEIDILKINEDCRGYTPQMALTPNRHLNSTRYKDFISNIGITSNLTIPKSIKRTISNVITHTNSVIKLTVLSHYSKSIDELERLIQEEEDKERAKDTTDILSLLFYLIVIVVAGIIIIKYKNKLKNRQSVNRVRRHLIELQNSRDVDELTRYVSE
ncbi:hypothetical protein ACI65C_009327, partial [Semiaphis heraclei]